MPQTGTAPGATSKVPATMDTDGTTPTTKPPKTRSGEEKPAKPVKPIDLKDEYDKANKDKEGGLNKSELKLLDKTGSIKDYDKDEDGKVSTSEYRARQREQNSFKGLDADKDGQLSTKEMEKLRRVTTDEDNAFDADGDGAVSKAEFNKARKMDIRVNREARREADFEKLDKKELEKLSKDKSYDKDGDGKLTVDEYHKGTIQDWKDDRNKKMDHLFEKAGGKEGALDVKDAKAYKSYDEDGDGKVSKEEFKDGFLADRKEYWNQHTDAGAISKELKERLGLNELGLGLNHIEKPKKPEAGHGHDHAAHGHETVDTPQGEMVKFGDHMISARIADNFKKMVEAAEKDGVKLEINSGYRSREEQEALYQAYLNGTGNLAAKPGTSNHEHGDAIDFANNPGAYDWLANNAPKFGLHNLPGEPWHYSPTGN